MVVVAGQPQLLQIVLALAATCSLTCLLYSWQQQRDQDGDDADDTMTDFSCSCPSLYEHDDSYDDTEVDDIIVPTLMVSNTATIDNNEEEETMKNIIHMIHVEDDNDSLFMNRKRFNLTKKWREFLLELDGDNAKKEQKTRNPVLLDKEDPNSGCCDHLPCSLEIYTLHDADDDSLFLNRKKFVIMKKWREFSLSERTNNNNKRM